MTTSITGERVRRAQDPDAPLISLVIPTFNEAGNIPELLARLASSVPEDVPAAHDHGDRQALPPGGLRAAPRQA